MTKGMELGAVVLGKRFAVIGTYRHGLLPSTKGKQTDRIPDE